MHANWGETKYSTRCTQIGEKLNTLLDARNKYSTRCTQIGEKINTHVDAHKLERN